MSRATTILVVGATAALASCVFELGAVVDKASGGAGGASASGGGGAGGTAGPTTYEVVITYAPSSADVQNFPLMVRLTPERIDYAATTAGADDLRFVSGSGETLAHDVETWQPDGESIVWVKMPTVLAAGGTLLMRYGDASAPEGGGATEVWSDYVGVYHLADRVEQTPAVADAGGTGHDGTATDVAESSAAFIGRGMTFNGSSSWIDMGSQPDWDVDAGEQRSFSSWFARGTTQELHMVLGRTKVGCCTGWLFQILADEYANMRSDLALGSCCVGGETNFNTGAPALPGRAADMDWHLVVTVMDRVNGTHRLYLDGVELENVALATEGDMGASAAALGVNETNDGGWFLGSMDETRVATFAATPAWIGLRNIAERDQLLTFGAPRRAND